MAFDIAVILQTICRPSVYRSITSVFEQRGAGRIHLLIGVDRGEDDSGIRDFVRNAPEHVACSIVNIGMSNSIVRGGIYTNRFGGSLRSGLSMLANAQHVAYLDDDDWWDERHLASLLAILATSKWAFSLRRYVNPVTGVEIGEDQWESLGPGKGFFQDQGSGFVCPSCLAFDKLRYANLLYLWSFSSTPWGDCEDRMIYDGLVRSSEPWACTNLATTFYALNPADRMHDRRLEWFRAAGYELSLVPTEKTERG
ncbi:MAG TPA: hypothetical protein VNT30_20650 [Stellaceae bacterium]|nr:hypothetical protein [Stellaceae bacterium]